MFVFAVKLQEVRFYEEQDESVKHLGEEISVGKVINCGISLFL